MSELKKHEYRVSVKLDLEFFVETESEDDADELACDQYSVLRCIDACEWCNADKIIEDLGEVQDD